MSAPAEPLDRRALAGSGDGLQQVGTDRRSTNPCLTEVISL